MIKYLDDTLKSLLIGQATPGSELASATISFAAPDKDWRASGTGLVLSIYLYRVLENAELRSNERRRIRNPDGTVTLEAAPTRIECSYLVTAWNKSVEIPGVDKELQEHHLLSQALFVLRSNPIIPRAYLSPGLANQAYDLPAVSAVNDDTGAKPDFWSALETYLRPSITSKVTIGLDLAEWETAPEVSSAWYRVGGESFFSVGGLVFDSAVPPNAIAGAWVRVDETGRVYATDAEGKFRISGLTSGTYSLTVRAVGFLEGTRPITLPSPDGVFDLTLIPIP